MKKLINCIITAILAVSLISCGGANKEEEEQRQAAKGLGTALGELVKMGKEMEKSAKENEGKMAARRAKGDTMAMPYAELQKLLPASVEGYKPDGEPDGGSVNMTGMSYSSAEQRYKNEKGDWLKVSIVDYNQAYAMYSSLTGLWAVGMSIDTPEEKANGVKLENDIAGWEVFKKKSKNAIVTLGVGDRFWVNVEANNQSNTDLVKSVAQSVDLSKLSEL